MKTVVLEMTLPAPPLGGDPGCPSATEHRVGHDGNFESVRSDQVSANARRLAAIELSHETEHTVSEFDRTRHLESWMIAPSGMQPLTDCQVLLLQSRGVSAAGIGSKCE
jgi:hypothetical protein